MNNFNKIYLSIINENQLILESRFWNKLANAAEEVFNNTYDAFSNSFNNLSGTFNILKRFNSLKELSNTISNLPLPDINKLKKKSANVKSTIKCMIFFPQILKIAIRFSRQQLDEELEKLEDKNDDKAKKRIQEIHKIFPVLKETYNNVKNTQKKFKNNIIKYSQGFGDTLIQTTKMFFKDISNIFTTFESDVDPNQLNDLINTYMKQMEQI